MANGLWSQLFLAASIALAAVPEPTQRQHPAAPAIAMAGLLGIVVSFFWQGIVTAWKVRDELLELDYLNNRPERFVVLYGSVGKFFAITTLGLPFVYGFIALIFASSEKSVGHLFAPTGARRKLGSRSPRT